MSNHPPKHAIGRTGAVALIVLALAAVALYLYSERAVPPESPESIPASPRPAASDDAFPGGDSRSPSDRPSAAEIGDRGDGPDRPDSPAATPDTDSGPPGGGLDAEPDVKEAPPSPPPVSIEQAGARLRVALAERLLPEQLDRVVSSRLIERLVATVNSLDGVPVPLRFRPLAHVPDLPRIASEGDGLRLPAQADPRYRPYRNLFDRLDAATLAGLFERHEPAFDAAWQALGETSQPSFRARLIEVLDHIAEFEMPETRPRLVRPEVLYEFGDPGLEAESWGRKILIRVGPEHAGAIQRKARALAAALRRPGTVEDAMSSRPPDDPCPDLDPGPTR